MGEIMNIKVIREKIIVVRGIKVMLDRDLAELYEVPTKRLNEQVKRNLKRFPRDFMFRLTKSEVTQVVANCDHLKTLKFSPQQPYAFTEHGVAMLSSVLNSERAISVNIAIIRAFVKLREVMAMHKEFIQRLSELERRMGKKDREVIALFEAIRKLMNPPQKKKAAIGFHARK